MDTVMNNFGTVVLWIGAIDSAVILALGIAAAAIYMFGLEAKAFYERVIPSVSILVGTSIAAGIVMLVARWVSRLF